MTLEQRVISVKDEDVSWGFDDKGPCAHLRTPNSTWPTYAHLDPYPCYSHNRALVLQCAREAEKRFPLGWQVFYFLLPYESSGRTNGTSTSNSIDRKEGHRDGVIYLSGKRIPLHPAMTRYLLFHEYSHQVDDWVCHKQGLEHNGLDKEYAEMRGIKLNDGYGARKWHTNIGEIIANDARICLFNAESEFWPHECKHPNECPEVQMFWYRMIEEFSHRH